EIITELFAAVEQRLSQLASTPRGRLAGVEDLWFFLHLLFEAMWDYRFLYRDLDEILSRDRMLAARFGRMMRRGTDTVIRLCRSMVDAGALRAAGRENTALASTGGLGPDYGTSIHTVS